MEIRQIPDYPNYGVTRDGRVWSYSRNKFRKIQNKSRWGAQVLLWIDGVGITKLVSRLVFLTYNGYEPECIVYKDGNKFNVHLDNLGGTTRAALNKKMHSGKNYGPKRKIFRTNIETGFTESIEICSKDKAYVRVHKALQRRSLTSGGYLYYYEGEKEELVKELLSRIKSSQLTLKYLNHSSYNTCIKNHIQRCEKYLEILEGA